MPGKIRGHDNIFLSRKASHHTLLAVINVWGINIPDVNSGHLIVAIFSNILSYPCKQIYDRYLRKFN